MTTCTECAEALKPGAMFCGSCGAPVAQTPAAQATAVQPPAAPVVKAVDLPAGGSLLAANPAVPGAPRTPPSNLVIGLISAGALLVIVGVGVGIGIWATTPSGTSSSYSASSDDDADDSPSADSSESADEAVTFTEEPTAEPPVLFESISGNITCSMGPESVLCHQSNTRYTPPSQSCVTALGGATVGLTHESATWPCLDSSIAGTVAVEYDVPVAAYGFTCTINYVSGITCTNERGAGFVMEFTNGIQAF